MVWITADEENLLQRVKVLLLSDKIMFWEQLVILLPRISVYP